MQVPSRCHHPKMVYSENVPVSAQFQIVPFLVYCKNAPSRDFVARASFGRIFIIFARSSKKRERSRDAGASRPRHVLRSPLRGTYPTLSLAIFHIQPRYTSTLNLSCAHQAHDFARTGLSLQKCTAHLPKRMNWRRWKLRSTTWGRFR
jgi:hypothetical protein